MSGAGKERRAWWERTLVWVLLVPIHVYRYTLSPLMGGQCRFQPTCSAYALEAIRTHGPWRGTWLMVLRLGRCHPLCKGGWDPVPPKSE